MSHEQNGPITAASYALEVPTQVRHGLALGLLLGAGGLVLAVAGFESWRALAIGLLVVGALAAAVAVVLAAVIGEQVRMRARQRIMDAVGWRGDETVLDVGCGNGFLLVEAAKRLTTGRATGIDLWKAHAGGQSADAVRRNAAIEGVAEKVELADVDARRMPFGDGSFDVVMSSLMLHHAGGRADREQVVAEMMRVARPGARVLLYDMRPIVQRAAQQLRAAGFVEVERLGGWLLAVVTAKKPR